MSCSIWRWLLRWRRHPRSQQTHAEPPVLERHPYEQGPLGRIQEGAYADILLVDGNPLDDVSILGDSGKNIPLIMKDGRIFKNTIQ